MHWKIAGTVLLLILCFGVPSAWEGIPASHLQEALRLKKEMIQRYEQGQYEEATHIGKQLLARVEEDVGLENPFGAEILDFQGDLYSRMGKYTEAVTLLQRAVTIREKVLGSEHPDTARSLNSLAWAYLQNGRPDEALQLCQRAVTIIEKAKGPDDPDLAYFLKDLGNAYLYVGDKEKALAIEQRALAIEEKTLGSEHPAISATLNSLAHIYLTMKESKPALPLLQRALAIREKALGPDHPDTAITLNLLGRFYLKNGDVKEGFEALQRALAIQEKVLGPYHPETLTTRDELLTLPVPQVLPLLQQLLEDKEKTFGPDHSESIYTRTKLANGFVIQKEYQKALQLFERNLQAEAQSYAKVLALLTEDQKRKLVEELAINYHGALWTIRTAFPKDEVAVRIGLEFVLRRKGIVLDIQSHAQQSLAANLRGETLQSWQRLTQYRSELSHLFIAAPEQQDLPKKKLQEDLQAAITQEEEFLAQHNPVMAKALPQLSISAQEIAKHLPLDSALVEFVRIWDYGGISVAMIGGGREWMDNIFAAYTIAFVLTPDNHITLVDLGRVDLKIMGSMMSIVNAKSHSDLKAVKADTTEADNALAELYNLLIRPLEIALGSCKWLIISPDGELNKIPFAALRTPDGRYLIEKMTVSYVSSGRDLLRAGREEPATVDLLLVANPAFDDREASQAAAMSNGAVQANDCAEHFDPLDKTVAEARIIPQLLAGTQQILQGREATESAVRSARSPKVLHIATHGLFCKNEGASPSPVNPLVRSGLALAGANHAKEISTGDDGILTALEVSGMNLYGTDLVVLSACETGLGDVQVGEGVYGLRRAFVLAGAKNLVMSLWKVNDTITLDQMVEFYRGYARGESPAVALREAQLKSIAVLREQTTAALGAPLAPVRLWAPFIVQQTGEAPGSSLLGARTAGYQWWNLIVPLLGMIGLLVLSRMRFSVVPAEAGVLNTAPQEGRTRSVPYARLVLHSPFSGVRQEVACLPDEMVLGSGSDCDAVLHHPSIARQHARVRWHKQGYVIRDLESPTGTFVNGRRVTESLLKDGWRVRLGEVEFIFHEEFVK